jgi:Domain of unknown function (DUF4249)
MRNLKYILVISFLNITLLNCKEVYNPPSVKNNPFLLVVDGIIFSGTDSSKITLSRTKSLTDTAPQIKEKNAQVSVMGKSGVEYPFTELGNGQYAIDHLLLDTSQQYQLKIITSDKNEFRSELSNVHPSPPIDSLYWAQDSAGAYIYVNTHDPTNNTRYYRYEYGETWEYYSDFDSFLEYINENNIIPRPLSNQIYRCYQSDNSTNIEVTSTAKLSSDIVYKYEVVFIPIGSIKISALYSTLIKQYAITADGFSYWTNLKKNTEQLGTLFDLQPFSELGNIQCMNNPDTKCIGFISFTTLQQQRIFISRNDLIAWNYQPYYGKCILKYDIPELISTHFQPPGGPYGNSLIGQGLDTVYHLPVYYYSSNLCVDCTNNGGSAIKPTYWP